MSNVKKSRSPLISSVRFNHGIMVGDACEVHDHLSGATRVNGKPFAVTFDADMRFIRIAGGWRSGDVLIPLANVASLTVEPLSPDIPD